MRPVNGRSITKARRQGRSRYARILRFGFERTNPGLIGNEFRPGVVLRRVRPTPGNASRRLYKQEEDMRNLPIKTALCTGLLLFGGGFANAQYQYQNPPQIENHVAANNQTFDRVRGDLDRVEGGTIAFTADRGRIVAAKDLINQFQGDLNAGAYRPNELNQAITAVRRVVEMNRMSDWSHDALVADLGRLQEMKSTLDEEWR
jgi:hypothetical protein